jgi:DNA-binding transcriptional MerR regulator
VSGQPAVPAAEEEPRDRADGTLLGIGDVIAALADEFPEVTISKVRFLETEGLVQPERTQSGYRKFRPADVDRLRYVLTMQRDHYLPLRVIREHLDAIDRGLEPPVPVGSLGPRVPDSEDMSVPDDTSVRGRLRLSRDELLEESGLSEDTLGALEAAGLVSAQGRHFDASSLVVAATVAQMMTFGLEIRHLRPFRLSAERQAALVHQVVSPMARSRNAETRERAELARAELASLALRLQATLLRQDLGLDRTTG